jgi:hypothetical protein
VLGHFLQKRINAHLLLLQLLVVAEMLELAAAAVAEELFAPRQRAVLTRRDRGHFLAKHGPFRFLFGRFPLVTGLEIALPELDHNILAGKREGHVHWDVRAVVEHTDTVTLVVYTCDELEALRDVVY